MEVINIEPRDCVRWKFANRSSFEFGDLNLLAEDIKRNGQIEPVFVRKLVNNDKFKYEIIAGSRRFQACLNANLVLKAVVCDVSDIEASVIQTRENSHLSLSDYSKGISYAKLQKELKISQKELAEVAECSRRKMESLLYFAKVDQVIWDAVANMSKVSAKSAETIYLISKKSRQHKDALIEIAEEIRKGAGSRRIEQLVDKIILGDKNSTNDELIQSSDGTIYATWKNGKIVLSNNLNFDKKKLSAHLLQFFTENC